MTSGDIIFIPRNKITKASQVMALITAPTGYASAILYDYK